jgi:hypothetical protein
MTAKPRIAIVMRQGIAAIAQWLLLPSLAWC